VAYTIGTGYSNPMYVAKLTWTKHEPKKAPTETGGASYFVTAGESATSKLQNL